MSCQQAARLLTTNTNTRTREDPYVFTETVPNTPPVLFNIQKTRAKLPESSGAATGKLTSQKLPLTQLNGFAAKTQASLANVVSISTTTIAATTNFKNVTQSHQQQNHQQLQQQAHNKKKSQNVFIVRPHHQQIQQQTVLPTPSLWQTPLLLDTVVSPPTSPASLPSPTPASSAPASVSSATLPPSNFHHTTFAQHLQKVGCIRKPAHSPKEKSVSKDVKETANISDATQPQPLGDKEVPDVEPSKKSSSLESLQHSDNDLNEIPVNVIYRKPQPTGEIACTLIAANGSPAKPQAAVTDPNHESVGPTPPSPATVASTRDALLTSSPTNNVVAVVKRDLIAQKPTSSIVTKQTPDQISIFKADSNTDKYLQTDSPLVIASSKTQKRRAAPTAVGKAAPHLYANKKSRRGPSVCAQRQTNAFAVVTCPEKGYWADVTETKFPPYCLQQHWLGVYDLKVAPGSRTPTALSNIEREERIAQHKNVLRRQAMQLLATQKLLRYPLQAARHRLICVDRLLRKYENHSEDDFTANSCIVTKCNNQALPMTTHCYEHIGYNADQHLFLSCTAKFSDNSQCRIPVFDIVHDLPLCTEHARKRDAYNRIWHEQRPRKMSSTSTASLSYDEEFRRQQQLQSNGRTFAYNNSSATKPVRNKRKSSTGAKPVGRPQKRFKKTVTTATPPPLSAVKHRKSSNTSLESIASNSHSSHSQPPFVTSATANVVLAPPALAPLSGGRHFQNQNDSISRGCLPLGSVDFNRMLSFGGNSANEDNSIIAQFAMMANNSSNNNNNNSSCSNSHTDFSSGLSSLPSADEILTQDMMSICENSSAYASSEDTGVGGLSETELMVGAHDAEEIPLGDTRLLEEHDLANVLNTLPVDAFNELFTAVRQDERDEVERALELADKHLKTLQQTIGTDSDFLGDFLDVNDHILDDTDICSKMEIVSSVLHSPDTSGIDTATLFADGGSNSGGGGCTSGVTDIRGLVQT